MRGFSIIMKRLNPFEFFIEPTPYVTIVRDDLDITLRVDGDSITIPFCIAEDVATALVTLSDDIVREINSDQEEEATT